MGIRYVCVDRISMERCLSFLLRSETFKIRDVEIYRPFFPEFENFRDGAPDFVRMTIGEPIPVIPKASNYESIHIEVALDAPIDRYGQKEPLLDIHKGGDGDEWTSDFSGGSGEPINDTVIRVAQLRRHVINERLANMPADVQKIVCQFPIEVQVRTFPDHIWAFDDHKFVYSKKKSHTYPIDSLTRQRSRDAFSTLKFNLKFIEMIRNVISLIHTQTFQKYRIVESGRKIDSRLHFFDFDTRFDKIVEKLKQIDNENANYVLARKNNDAIDPDYWKKTIERIRALADEAKEIETKDYFLSGHDGNLEFWGRQRVFALLMGFVFLFCLEQKTERDIADKAEVASEAWAFVKKLDLGVMVGNLFDGGDYVATRENFSADIAARFYQFIDGNDRYFMYFDGSLAERDWLFDPLVYARLATALYRLGVFSAAYKQLDEFFGSEYYREGKYWDDPYHRGHSRLELRVRMLEYRWCQCEQNREQILANQAKIESLIQEIFDILKNGRLTDAEKGDEWEKDYGKALCWLIWVIGVLGVWRIGISTGIRDMFINLSKEFREKYDTDNFNSALKGKVYFLAAMAVVEWRERRETAIEQHLGDAANVIQKRAAHPPAASRVHADMLATLRSRILDTGVQNRIMISHHADQFSLVRAIKSGLQSRDFEVAKFREDSSASVDAVSNLGGSNWCQNYMVIVDRKYLEAHSDELDSILIRMESNWLRDDSWLFILLIGMASDDFERKFGNYPVDVPQLNW